MFGDGGTNESSQPENSVPEVKPIAMTDEIKNAALNSGLVQYNNDIFQRGGYITVADFVEKYKDKYDITYIDGTYEECKEYLLEYFNYNTYIHSNGRWTDHAGYPGKKYCLYLTDKNNSASTLIAAYVVNATSPEEKITLDKGIVAEIEPYKIRYQYDIPEWFPMGFADAGRYFSVTFESESQNYTVKTLCEALEANGIKEKEEESKNDINTYWFTTIGSTDVKCYVLGEENLFGAKPVYYYDFIIDSNTDKVSYVKCTLDYFVEE